MALSRICLRCLSQRAWCAVVAMLCAFFLVSCSPHELGDQSYHHKTSSQYEELNKPAEDDFDDLVGDSTPKDEPISGLTEHADSSDATELPEVFQKPVTVVLTDHVSLGEAFKILSDQVQISVFIDPGVSDRSIVFTAHQQPLIQVIKGLCETAGVRYHIQGSRLMIQKDVPYAQNYTLPFLSMSRQFSHHLNVSTDVLGAAEGQAQVGDNGSHTHMHAEAKNDFWQEVEASLKTILSTDLSGGAHYAVHRQACLVSVVTTQKHHQDIAHYMQALKSAIGSQVLIEAKIIEVSLNNEFKNGIDWQSLNTQWPINLPFGDTVGQHSVHNHRGSSDQSFVIGGHFKNLKALVKMMERFGTARTLSSPRLTVMNNQTAMMKVAHNEVFFQVQYTQQLGGLATQNRDYVSATSKIQSVPIGFVMTVHPSINPQTQEIIMTLRPSISRVAGVRRDPAVAIVGQQLKGTSNTPIHSEIPVVEVREMDSVLTAKSGEVIMLGGLMQEKTEHEKAGLPLMSKMPMLGGLFRGQSDQRLMTELVIFLRVRILKKPSLHRADRRLYRNFVSDPRPIA